VTSGCSLLLPVCSHDLEPARTLSLSQIPNGDASYRHLGVATQVQYTSVRLITHAPAVRRQWYLSLRFLPNIDRNVEPNEALIALYRVPGRTIAIRISIILISGSYALTIPRSTRHLTCHQGSWRSPRTYSYTSWLPRSEESMPSSELEQIHSYIVATELHQEILQRRGRSLRRLLFPSMCFWANSPTRLLLLTVMLSVPPPPVDWVWQHNNVGNQR